MSSKPHPAGAAEVLKIVRRVNAINEELPALIAASERLKKLQTERDELGAEVQRQLESMDCDTPGNFGWSSRLAWLLHEIVRQADFSTIHKEERTILLQVFQDPSEEGMELRRRLTDYLKNKEGP
jgi:hypothetical protein